MSNILAVSDDEWTPPTETESKVLQARRERQDRISKLLGEYLLRGYKMLGSSCSSCDVSCHFLKNLEALIIWGIQTLSGRKSQGESKMSGKGQGKVLEFFSYCEICIFLFVFPEIINVIILPDFSFCNVRLDG